MSLIHFFESYYLNPFENQKKLMNAIFEYDFSNLDELEEISLLKKKYLCNSVKATQLESNGSSKTNKFYKFHPLFPVWRECIENKLRGHNTIQLVAPHSGCVPKIIVYDIFCSSIDYLCYLSIERSDNGLKEFIEIVRSKSETGIINLSGMSDVWFRASMGADTIEYLLECGINSIINFDWELFVKSEFKHKFQINDQMIDWKTGLNFYTCKFGKKHFLPIFHIIENKISNLLNLYFDSEVCTDYFKIIGERRKCSCGKFYYLFDFKSHYKNYLDIDRNIINKLQSRYLGLQFIQIKDILYVLHSPINDNTLDINILKEELSDYKLVFLKDHSCWVGRKIFNFWKDDDLNVNGFIKYQNKKNIKHINHISYM